MKKVPGESLTFGVGVILCLLGSVIWGWRNYLGSKISGLGPKCTICCLKFGVGKVIWGLIFLVCHCPNHFLGIKFFFRNWTADYLGSFKNFV